MRGPGLVLAQTVPLGHRLARALAHLPPVFSATGRDTVCPQDQPAHHLVLGGAIEVDDEELDADLRQEVGGDIVDEGLVEDGVQSALLHVGFLLGDALSAVVDVHLDIRIWEPPQRDKAKGDRPMTRFSLTEWGFQTGEEGVAWTSGDHPLSSPHPPCHNCFQQLQRYMHTDCKGI